MPSTYQLPSTAVTLLSWEGLWIVAAIVNAFFSVCLYWECCRLESELHFHRVISDPYFKSLTDEELAELKRLCMEVKK